MRFEEPEFFRLMLGVTVWSLLIGSMPVDD